MPSVYEHLDVLAERFAHLDEATIRRALAQAGGHGGKAALCCVLCFVPHGMCVTVALTLSLCGSLYCT